MAVSNNTFARIQLRAENRILARLQKPYKRIREEYAKKQEVPNVVNEIQQAIFFGILTAFILGRTEIVAEEYKRGKKQFLDVADAEAIQYVLKSDKDLFYSLVGKRLFREIMNEADAMSAYFSPSQGAMEFLKDYSFDLALRKQGDISKVAQRLFDVTLEEGMSNKEAATFLQKGIGDLTRTSANAIARTESTRAFNFGTLSEAQSSDMVIGYRYNAILDNATTDICRERNGKYIPKDDIRALATNTPPLHVNCRSRLETVFKGERTGELIPADAPETKNRPSDIKAVVDFLT